MKLITSFDATGIASQKEVFFTPALEYIESVFFNLYYGKGLISIYASLNCYGPIPGSKSPIFSFETGFLLTQKYTRSLRRFEIEVKLNYEQVLNVSNQSMAVQIISDAFKSIIKEIELVNIKEFKIEEFKKDVFYNLYSNAWLANPWVRVQWPYDWEESQLNNIKNNKSIDLLYNMSEKRFWQLITQAGENTSYAPEYQCDTLIKLLSNQSEKQIVGFEVQLRKQLKKLYRYDVLALAKLVEGYVSDDSFLYFCCNIILFGQETFIKVITQPDLIETDISPKDTGEFLLSVANEAFQLSFGSDTTKTFPRDIAVKIHDYNNFPIVGLDLTDYEVSIMFPKFFEKYNKK